MNFLTALLSFIAVAGILVLVHEFGHYIVARLMGVKVLSFSIGLGTPLWSKRTKSGTEWQIAALPLGGYVKMLDERNAKEPLAAHELPYAFNRQSVGKRFAIIAAGPVANFLLAIVLFAGVFATGIDEPAAVIAAPHINTPAEDAGLVGGEVIVGIRPISNVQPNAVQSIRSWSEFRWRLIDAAMHEKFIVLVAKEGDNIYHYPLDLRSAACASNENCMEALGFMPGNVTPKISGLEPNSPAEQAGLRKGDRILAVDGQVMNDLHSWVSHIKTHPGQKMTLKVEREGSLLSLPVLPETINRPNDNPIGRIGAVFEAEMKWVKVQYDLLEAVWLSMRKTWDVTVFSVRTFGHMITGEVSLKNLAGPVSIADYAGKSARLGFANFVSFLALVSISLGILNLLPIPVLDGGYLLYYSVEAITGRALSDYWQLILQRVGILCIIVLSMIALFNDLSRLIRF